MTNSTNPILDRFVAINNIWRRTIYANFQGTIDLLKEVDWDLSGGQTLDCDTAEYTAALA